MVQRKRRREVLPRKGNGKDNAHKGEGNGKCGKGNYNGPQPMGVGAIETDDTQWTT